MHMCRAATVVMVFFLALGTAQARTLDQVPPYLGKEGNFVKYPAIAVGGVGMVVGGLIGLPAAVVSTPIGFLAGDPLGYAMLPSAVLATAGTEAGYHIGGAIPWAVKNAVYDAPMAGIAKIRGEPASGLVAQVDPPPAVQPTDLQYLASTPEGARIPVQPPYIYSTALPPPREPTSLMLKRQLSPFKPPATPVPAARASRAPAPLAAPAPLPHPTVPAATAEPAPVAPVTPVSAAAPAAPVAPVAPVQPRTVAPQEPATSARESVVDDADVEQERPSLRKKKKRKFSERFGF